MSGFVLALDGREIDVARGLVRTREAEISLTTLQRELLRLLVEAAGAVVTREALLERLWGTSRRKGGSRPVDALIHQLRTILERDPSEPRYLLTVRGQGYRLKVPLPRTNLPEQGPPEEVSDELLSAVLRSGAGWTQLSGPPGSGQSEAARRACLALASRLPGGAWWLDCREFPRADLLLGAITALLGAQAGLEGLLASLAQRPPLALVLDGLDPVDGIEALLEALCQEPRLRLLGTTSRQLKGASATVLLQAPPEAAALAWHSCSPDEKLLLSRCLRWRAPCSAEAALAVAEVPPGVVQGLTERWLLQPVEGKLQILPSLRGWMEETLGSEPAPAFVRYLARSEDAAVPDLFTALHDGIALGCLAEVALLADALLARAPGEHRALGIEIERVLAASPPPEVASRLQIAAAHAAVLAGDLARARAAREACGLAPQTWAVRALDCALGPLLHAELPDPGPVAPEGAEERVSWARLRGVALVGAGQAREGVVWLRRSQRGAQQRGDRVAVRLAEGEILSALTRYGAPPGPAAQDRERLADELSSLGSLYEAAKGHLAAAQLRATLGERALAERSLARCSEIALQCGFLSLQRRARIEQIALDLADERPEVLLAQLAPLEAELEARPDAGAQRALACVACLAEGRAGQTERARIWAERGRCGWALQGPLTQAACALRGAELTDREVLEVSRTDPRLRALAVVISGVGIDSTQVQFSGGPR